MTTAVNMAVSSAPSVARADARLAGIGYPTRRDEAWRYAPHRRLGDLRFGPSLGVGDLLDDALAARIDESIPALGGPRIVVVNGVVDHGHSRFDAPDGVRLSTIAESPDVALEHRLDDEAADAYRAVNIAYAYDGAVVDVDEGVACDVPIHVVDVAVPGVVPNASCTGVVVHLRAGSSATVVETRIGLGDDFGGSNVLTTVRVDEDATLDHVLLQDLPAAQVHLGRMEVTQDARSTFRTRSYNLGAFYGRLDCDVVLDGPGATADLGGLYFGVGDQILDQQITVVHAATDCTSRQSYRGVLDDASTGVFRGGIDVRPGADGTDAAQSNDNLLLSDRAEVDTQPRLEILADEVACTHGATVGQLDDTALYYLRSRGITSTDARRLLINGFADQIVDDVADDTARQWITRRLGHDHD